MPMFAWGLDEIAEGVGLIYVFIIGLLVLLVKLERGLDRGAETPHPARPSSSAASGLRRRQHGAIRSSPG